MTDKISTKDAAAELGVAAETIRRMANSGALPAERTPLGRLFARADIERVAAERRARQVIPAVAGA